MKPKTIVSLFFLFLMVSAFVYLTIRVAPHLQNAINQALGNTVNLNLQVIVGYKDGTTWVVDSTKYSQGLTIIDPNNQDKEVSWLQLELYVYSYLKPAMSYKVEGTATLTVFQNESKVYVKNCDLVPVTSSPLAPGSPVLVSKYFIQALDLDFYLSINGVYKLTFKVNSFTLKMSFPDGSGRTMEINRLPELVWVFEKKGPASYVGHYVNVHYYVV